MTQAGLFILAAMLGAAILGFLIAWLLRGSKIAYWRDKFLGIEGDYQTKERELNDRNRYTADLEATRESLSAEKLSLTSERDDWRTKFNRMKSDYDARAGVNANFKDLKGKYEELEARFKGQDATISDLMETNRQLEMERSTLSSKITAGAVKSDSSEKVVEKVVEKDNSRELQEMEQKLRTVRDRNDKLNADFNELNKKFNAFNTVKAESDAKLEASYAEIEALKAKVAASEGNDNKSEMDSLNSKMAGLQADLNKAQSDYNSLQMTNGSLLQEIEVLKVKGGGDADGEAKVVEKIVEVEKVVEKLVKVPVQDVDVSEYTNKIADLEAQLAAGSSQSTEIKEVIVEKIVRVPAEGGDSKLKADYEASQAEVDALKKKLEELRGNAEGEAAPVSKEEKKRIALQRVRERAQSINFERIGIATESEKDDLKEIKGIGPFIEEKLNALGIYTFRQISKFVSEDEDKVNEAIEFFPGRIKRDDWKGQAKVLADNKE